MHSYLTLFTRHNLKIKSNWYYKADSGRDIEGSGVCPFKYDNVKLDIPIMMCYYPGMSIPILGHANFDALPLLMRNPAKEVFLKDFGYFLYILASTAPVLHDILHKCIFFKTRLQTLHNGWKGILTT